MDALKVGLVLLVRELRGGGGEPEKTLGRTVGSNVRSPDIPQRVSPAEVGHPGTRGDTPDPQGSAKEPLPGVA